MKAIKVIFPLFLMIFTCSLMAQTEKLPKDKLLIELESTILMEKRIISIDLPDDYTITDSKYPVLYLLDGRTHFKHASAAVDFLSGMGAIPQVIVVSIHNIDRNRDFSPVHTERIPTSGGAEKFLNFLSEELTTYINSNYRSSGMDILLGHSFGGTFAVYSLLEKPGLFDAFIAVSPALQYADNYLVKEAEKGLKPYKGNRYFYMTVGNEPNYFDALSTFSKVIEEKAEETIQFKYVKMPSENHNTTPYSSVFSGLRYIFSDWQITPDIANKGLTEIDAFYANLSAKYGNPMETPERIINNLGYTYLQVGKIENAISVFEENVKRYPKSANVYDSMGDAFENDGQLDKAAKFYQEAYDIGKKKNDPNASIYKTNLNRVMDQ
jgi:predicted alpha/beta superfamily hydrolase